MDFAVIFNNKFLYKDIYDKEVFYGCVYVGLTLYEMCVFIFHPSLKSPRATWRRYQCWNWICVAHERIRRIQGFPQKNAWSNFMEKHVYFHHFSLVFHSFLVFRHRCWLEDTYFLPYVYEQFSYIGQNETYEKVQLRTLGNRSKEKIWKMMYLELVSCFVRSEKCIKTSYW